MKIEREPLECGWCKTTFTPGPRGRLPKWCSASCRQRACEQRRAAASGLAAVGVVNRVVMKAWPPPHEKGLEWLRTLRRLEKDLDSGWLWDQHVMEVVAALELVMAAAHLGEEGRSSARNGSLLKILEDVPIPGEERVVCENRGSGVRAMLAALRDAGMSPPIFKDLTTSFEVIFPNHTLVDDATLEWLQHLGRDGLTDTQCIGLALMRHGEVMDNTRYRAASGITDSRIATTELQDLVARELVTQTGTKRGARYTLSDYALSIATGARRPRLNRRRQILRILEVRRDLSKSEISEILDLNPKTTEHWLRTLKHEGLVEPNTPGRGSRHTRYRLTAAALQGSLEDDDSSS